MKIFQDKGKTILPRVDSILLLSRLLIVVAVGALMLQNEINQQGTILLSILTWLIGRVINRIEAGQEETGDKQKGA